MKQLNPYANLPPGQMTEIQRRQFIDVGFKWFLAVLAAFIDFSLDCKLSQFITYFYVPYQVCYAVDIGAMILGIFNILTCVFATVDFNSLSKMGSPNSISRIKSELNKSSTFVENKRSVLSTLFDELRVKAPSDYVPPTLEEYNTIKKMNSVEIVNVSADHSAQDILSYQDYVEVSQTRTPVYIAFEPKYNKSEKYEYATSTSNFEPEFDPVSESYSLNRSQMDLLDISDHFAAHPDDHPLSYSKRKAAPTTAPSSLKRGKSLLQLSESGARLSGLSSSYVRRSPKFLMTQKPTLTSFTKTFNKLDIDSSTLIRMTEDLRQFIAKKIIIPLANEINTLNKTFLTSARTRTLVIGKTSIVDIEKIFGFEDKANLATLPYVLSFLRLHPNYAYLVKRILTWSRSEFIFDYCADAVSLPINSWPENFPAVKGPLPTDSELIFRLFSFFMDCHHGLNPLTYPHPCDLPFTHRHTLQEGTKPSEYQLSAYGYYLELSEAQPLTFKFYLSRYPSIVTPPTYNAMTAILLLLVCGHGRDWLSYLSQGDARV